MAGALHKSTARAQRIASGLAPEAPDQSGTLWLLNWRLSFGDFSLAPTEKSYPPSRGGFPRRCGKSQRLATKGAGPYARDPAAAITKKFIGWRLHTGDSQHDSVASMLRRTRLGEGKDLIEEVEENKRN